MELLQQEIDVLQPMKIGTICDRLEVMAEIVEHELTFYIEDRSFSVPEVKVMIAALSGSHRAEVIKGNIVEFNTRKHSKEVEYCSVGSIENSILERIKIIFCYFNLEANGNRKYRCTGLHYVVEPVLLALLEDNYYLIVYWMPCMISSEKKLRFIELMNMLLKNHPPVQVSPTL